MQQTKISGVFDRHCRWFPASSCLKADRPHAVFTLYPPGGNARRPLLSSRFWPEPDGTACNTSVWGPWDLLHARPHMCDHQFSTRGELDGGLTGWTREGSSEL